MSPSGNRRASPTPTRQALDNPVGINTGISRPRSHEHKKGITSGDALHHCPKYLYSARDWNRTSTSVRTLDPERELTFPLSSLELPNLLPDESLPSLPFPVNPSRSRRIIDVLSTLCRHSADSCSAVLVGSWSAARRQLDDGTPGVGRKHAGRRGSWSADPWAVAIEHPIG